MRSNDTLSFSSPFPEVSSTRNGLLYAQIRDRILSHELPAGYVFPNENEMCSMLQVGRGTLREAYQTLSANGLITRSKAGTTVNDTDTILSKAPLNIVASLSSFQDMLEFRLLLETECVKFAALRASNLELELLKVILEQSRLETSFDVLQNLDLKFHGAIINYSHNPLLINVYRSAWDAFVSLLFKNYGRLSVSSPEKLKAATTQHAAILDGLCAHDPTAATQAMQQHIYSVYGLPSGMDSPLP